MTAYTEYVELPLDPAVEPRGDSLKSGREKLFRIVVGLDPQSNYPIATKTGRALPGHPSTPLRQWIPGRAALARNDRNREVKRTHGCHTHLFHAKPALLSAIRVYPWGISPCGKCLSQWYTRYLQSSRSVIVICFLATRSLRPFNTSSVWSLSGESDSGVC